MTLEYKMHPLIQKYANGGLENTIFIRGTSYKNSIYINIVLQLLVCSKLSLIITTFASVISADSIARHTQIGYEVVLPSFKRLIAGKKDDDGTIAAKIGWWEVNQVWGVMSEFRFRSFA